MVKILVCLTFVCLSFLNAPEALAQQPSIADLKFDDGSLVRMKLNQEAIEVITKYGKLVVPVKDIRRIDFGLHIPDEMQEKIVSSIKRLASDVHKEREAAQVDLIAFGYFALPALNRAMKSGDQEVTRRASFIVTKISERTPLDLLKLREEDVIHTQDFPIVGKISAQTMKAHSPHFGDVELKLSELRTLHARQRPGSMDLVLDAVKHGSDLQQWRDVGLIVDLTQRLLITAEGDVDLWAQGPGQYMAKPKGYNTAGKGGQFMAGALVGKIGEKGKAFFIGERFDGAASEEGRLYLQITPGPWGSSSLGTYRVKVETGDR